VACLVARKKVEQNRGFAETRRRGFLAREQRLLKVGLYARVSTQDQKTLPMQIRALRAYVRQRGWTIGLQIKDIGSGASDRPQRELLMQAARRREIDAIVVWRLDRWGRSLADLVVTLKELAELQVGFISLTEALDLTTPTGRALAGLLAVFAEFEREILRERVKAGIAHARKEGRPHGRPPTARRQAQHVNRLYARGVSKAAIARRLHIGRTSVRRILASSRASEIR
jgi:DNA invertase Pin-like site-specific DNA recombinase